MKRPLGHLEGHHRGFSTLKTLHPQTLSGYVKICADLGESKTYRAGFCIVLTDHRPLFRIALYCTDQLQRNCDSFAIREARGHAHGMCGSIATPSPLV